MEMMQRTTSNNIKSDNGYVARYAYISYYLNWIYSVMNKISMLHLGSQQWIKFYFLGKMLQACIWYKITVYTLNKLELLPHSSGIMGSVLSLDFL